MFAICGKKQKVDVDDDLFPNAMFLRVFILEIVQIVYIFTNYVYVESVCVSNVK